MLAVGPMRGLIFSGLVFGMLPVVLSCGKAAVSNPEPRGTVIGVAWTTPGLSASRLVGAGCVQVVRSSDKKEFVEFSQSTCPTPASGLLPAEAVVFRVPVETRGDTLALVNDGVPIGLLANPIPAGKEGVPEWSFVHLCQVSDPSRAADPVFAEVCRVSFVTDGGEKQGRYLALRITPLEELARRKVADIKNLGDKEVRVMQRLAAVEREQEMARREMIKAQTDRNEAREALAEAQRGVRDSVASNLTVHRLLERTKLEAELEYAKKEARIYDQKIHAANMERERAALLKRRLEDSDRAKNREDAIAKRLEFFKTNGAAEADEFKQNQSLLDQNRALILTEEERRKVEESITYASAEAEKLKDLTEQSRLVLDQIIEARDNVIKLDRQPPPSPGIKPATED
jgi:hypothetical protein